ncbi:MAG: methyltransferase family protein [Burkholderiales bacterium]
MATLRVMVIRLKGLELKVPPPALAILVAGAMWGIASITPALEVSAHFRIAMAATIALIGIGSSVAAIISFRRAGTTINPMKPETTSLLVCKGIYSVSRNPMTVGLFLVLAAWAVLLSSGWAWIGPAAFVLYMNRFQIVPEEKVLSAKFGDRYSAYKSAVRRWL